MNLLGSLSQVVPVQVGACGPVPGGAPALGGNTPAYPIPNQGGPLLGSGSGQGGHSGPCDGEKEGSITGAGLMGSQQGLVGESQNRH